jgi:hypothetical protein
MMLTKLHSESVGSTSSLWRSQPRRRRPFRCCVHIDACFGVETEEVRDIVSCLRPFLSQAYFEDTSKPRICLHQRSATPHICGRTSRWNDRPRSGRSRCARLTPDRPRPGCGTQLVLSITHAFVHTRVHCFGSLTSTLRPVPIISSMYTIENLLLMCDQMVDGLCALPRVVGGVDGAVDLR